jgi:hypothetical protein
VKSQVVPTCQSTGCFRENQQATHSVRRVMSGQNPYPEKPGTSFPVSGF